VIQNKNRFWMIINHIIKNENDVFYQIEMLSILLKSCLDGSEKNIYWKNFK